MFLVLFIAALWGLGALGEYVCGRVILPAIGLTAPSYWTWFWFMFWVIVFGLILKYLEELIES